MLSGPYTDMHNHVRRTAASVREAGDVAATNDAGNDIDNEAHKKVNSGISFAFAILADL